MLISNHFSVENPNFRDSDRSVKTTIESTSTDLMKTQGYKNNRTGFSFGTSFEQYENIYFSPALSTYYEKLETSSKASAAKRKQDGNYFETLFNYGLTLNKLNQNFQPSEGYKSSFLQTVPLISDDLTLQNTYKFEQYFKLVDDMVFSYSFFGKI